MASLPSSTELQLNQFQSLLVKHIHNNLLFFLVLGDPLFHLLDLFFQPLPFPMTLIHRWSKCTLSPGTYCSITLIAGARTPLGSASRSCNCKAILAASNAFLLISSDSHPLVRSAAVIHPLCRHLITTCRSLPTFPRPLPHVFNLNIHHCFRSTIRIHGPERPLSRHDCYSLLALRTT